MNASENGTSSAITSSQVRAARALLGWTLDQLIAASGVPKRTLIRFENSDGVPRPTTVAAIRTAIEAAGVEFIPENGGGVGVRMKSRADAQN